MAKFLDTHNTASEINNVIRNAQGWLAIVSPYLSLSPILLERLQDAGSRNVQVTLIYGKGELKSEVTQALSTVKNMDVWFYENVHAKCYCNQDCAVITSMNMYEFSEKNNREMGVLLRKQTDLDAYNETCSEIHSIVRSSTRRNASARQANASLHGTTPPKAHYPRKQTVVNHQSHSSPSMGDFMASALNSLVGGKGYCLRCGNRIELDGEHPLCGSCYKEWNRYKNADFVEEYCHRCGKHAKTTIDKPLCRSCFAKTC